MPIFILSLPPDSGPPSGVTRTFQGLVVSATVNRAASLMVASVVTQRLRTSAVLYAAVRTFDPNSVPLPPLSGTPAGYVVTHHGLPQEAVSYSISWSIDGGVKARLPKLDVTLRGQSSISSEIFLTVALRRAGEEYRQTYGPFGGLSPNMTLTPTGWVTKLTSIDGSPADTDADSPLMPFFTEEYLPWERERDISSRAQALKAKADALEQREVRKRQRAQERELERQLSDLKTPPAARPAIRKALKDLRKQAKPVPDRRRVPVQDVLRYALSKLPLPFKLGGPLPWAGDFFWASEDTGFPFLGGTLDGVTYQVKGRSPLQVVEDLVSPVGWVTVTRYGEIYIGPPESLEEASASAGTLGLPEAFLTGVSIEQINPPGGGGGNTQRPRSTTITGASATLYEPPLPPEVDENGDLTDPADLSQLRDGTLSTSTTTYSISPDTGKYRVESQSTTRVVKADGLIRSETTTTYGMVPIPGGYSLYQVGLEWRVDTEQWVLREERETIHRYEDGTYPQAETETTSVTKAWVNYLGRSEVVERLTVSQSWHPEGWLQRKTTVKLVFDEFTYAIGNGPGGVVLTPVMKANREEEVEEWTVATPQTWLRTVSRFRTRWLMVTDEGGNPDSMTRGGLTERDSNITDQGPPRAPEDGDIEKPEPDDEEDPGDGYPYKETLSVTLATDGRGPAVTRSAPWATSLSVNQASDVEASIRRARPAQRTKYEVAAPPDVQVGTRVREFSLSGSAAGIKASVTLEEELNVL